LVGVIVYWFAVGLVVFLFFGGFAYYAVVSVLAKKNGKDFDVG
jgi:hypothetical protein